MDLDYLLNSWNLLLSFAYSSRVKYLISIIPTVQMNKIDSAHGIGYPEVWTLFRINIFCTGLSLYSWNFDLAKYHHFSLAFVVIETALTDCFVTFRCHPSIMCTEVGRPINKIASSSAGCQFRSNGKFWSRGRTLTGHEQNYLLHCGVNRLFFIATKSTTLGNALCNLQDKALHDCLHWSPWFLLH